MKTLQVLIALFACAFLPLQAAEPPASLDNVRNITFTIQNGTGVFGTYGRFVVYTDTRNNTYQLFSLSGDTANSSGTFTYSKTSTNGARLSANDSLSGVGIIQNLIFSTADSGTYSHSNNLGSQSGTFEIQYLTTTDPDSGAINELNNQIEQLTDLLAQKDAQLAQMTTERDSAITERDARPIQASFDAVKADRDARPTTEEVKDARLGSVVLQPDAANQSVKIRFSIEETDDFRNWIKRAEINEITVPLEVGKRFYRFALEDE